MAELGGTGLQPAADQGASLVARRDVNRSPPQGKSSRLLCAEQDSRWRIDRGGFDEPCAQLPAVAEYVTRSRFADGGDQLPVHARVHLLAAPRAIISVTRSTRGGASRPAFRPTQADEAYSFSRRLRLSHDRRDGERRRG